MSWQTAAVSTQIWLHALIRNCLKDIVKSSSWKSLSTDKTYLGTYSLFKNVFFREHHLESITDFRYRTATAKLRCSSHAFEIKHWRYQTPKHFVTNCSVNQTERRLLYSKISCKVPCFSTLSDFEKCLYLLTNTDPQIPTYFGKFVHQSFTTRNNIFLSQVTVTGISAVWRCLGFGRYSEAIV